MTRFRFVVVFGSALVSCGSLRAQNSAYSFLNAPSANLGDLVGPGIIVEGTRERSDLTIFNLFTAGWDEDSSKRVRATGTPYLALLRVQTNFMEREFRLNYFTQQNI